MTKWAVTTSPFFKLCFLRLVDILHPLRTPQVIRLGLLASLVHCSYRQAGWYQESPKGSPQGHTCSFHRAVRLLWVSIIALDKIVTILNKTRYLYFPSQSMLPAYSGTPHREWEQVLTYFVQFYFQLFWNFSRAGFLIILAWLTFCCGGGQSCAMYNVQQHPLPLPELLVACCESNNRNGLQILTNIPWGTTLIQLKTTTR